MCSPRRPATRRSPGPGRATPTWLGVYGLPVGLGSFVHADLRLDVRLAGALMGITTGR